MTAEEKIQFENKIRATMPRLKKNPYNYPIINKWNNRIWQKNKFAAFNIIEQAVTKEVNEMLNNELNDLLGDLTRIHCPNSQVNIQWNPAEPHINGKTLDAYCEW